MVKTVVVMCQSENSVTVVSDSECTGSSIQTILHSGMTHESHETGGTHYIVHACFF